MAITPQDKAYIKSLLDEGKTLDEAYLSLKSVKQKKGLTGGSFMTRAASVAENSQATPEVQQKATDVKDNFSSMNANIGEQSKIDEMKPSLGESALTALGGPILGAAPEIAKDAYQSAKTLGKGLVDLTKTAAPVASLITGNPRPLMNELKQPGEDKGTGLKETVQGAFGLAGSPFTGFMKAQLGEEKANKVMEVMNIPFEWATDKTFTAWAESQGIDTSTPEFAESRDQVLTAFQLFSTIAAPKVVGETSRKVKPVLESAKGAMKESTAGMGQKFISSTSKIDPSKTVEFNKIIGKNPGEWLQDRGIIAPAGETAAQLVEYWNTSKAAVDEGLAKVEGRFYDKSIENVLNDQIKYFEATADRPNLTLARKRLSTLKDEGLTLSETNSVKRLYESTEKLGYLKEKNSVGVARATNFDDSIREFMMNKAAERGFSNLAELNKETQAAKFLADEIYKKMDKQAANNVLGLTDQIMALGGAIDPRAWAALGLKKTMFGEAGKSFIAKLLSPEATAGIPEVPTKTIELKSKQMTELEAKLAKEAAEAKALVKQQKAEARQQIEDMKALAKKRMNEEQYNKFLEEFDESVQVKMLPEPESIQLPTELSSLDALGRQYRLGIGQFEGRGVKELYGKKKFKSGMGKTKK